MKIIYTRHARQRMEQRGIKLELLEETLRWAARRGAVTRPHRWNRMKRLVRDVRVIEQALGDGVKRVSSTACPGRS